MPRAVSFNKFTPSISLVSIIPCGLQERTMRSFASSFSSVLLAEIEAQFLTISKSLTQESLDIPESLILWPTSGELSCTIASVKNSLLSKSDIISDNASLSGNNLLPNKTKKLKEIASRGRPIFANSNIPNGSMF